MGLDQPENFRKMDIHQLYASFQKSTGVTTDSRKVEPGKIFFALKGDNFDGNIFAKDAIAAGAILAVVDDKSLSVSPKFLFVDDVLKTLQELASYHRKVLGIPLFALTGTNGKTTTKELITAVLATKYRVKSTSGNFNNHIGVPLTLLDITKDTEVAVIEMGASGPGEIRLLTSIALPNAGLITNVGKAHLLGFGSPEGVKKAKGEMYDHLLANNGTAFYNNDNSTLCEMISERSGIKTIKYGLKQDGYKILSSSAKNPFLRLKAPGYGVINTHLIGNYNADNIIAAISVGSWLGVNICDAAKAIESYIPSNNRSQLVKGIRNTLIVDAYNANPTSMRASLENFSKLKASKKCLIIGDMLELGAESQAEHKGILEFIKKLKPAQIFFVGREFLEAARDDKYFAAHARFFATSDELKAEFETAKPTGNTFLIKGSRGTRLEKCIETL